MTTYSYAACLKNSHKVNWRLDEVLGAGDFDPGKRWLPDALSGAHRGAPLDADAQRRLTHVEMASYAHLFAYVEEFIAPTMAGRARDFELEDRPAFDALTSFVAEEVKHMTLFRNLRDRVHETLGCEMTLLADQRETARFVISRNQGAVLLLIAAIEWMTQAHYQECFVPDQGLDPFTTHVFRSHWIEESQHAKLDHLETLRYFAGASPEEREEATSDLIALVAAVDGLLQKQSGFDVDNLARYLGRAFDEPSRSALFRAILLAKRHTFIATGVTHPRFVELLGEVATPAQRERIGQALAALFAAPVGVSA